MNKPLRIAAAFAGLLVLQGAGMGIAAAQDWTKAKIVKYRVEGVHNGREAVVKGDYEGKADVVDRVTLEYSWDTKKRTVIGAVTIVDGKSELSNMKSDGTNCPPPQLKGEYEHFQSVSNSMLDRDMIQINGKRTYPPASVSNYPASCSMRSIPGGKEDAVLWVPIGATDMLAMPGMTAGPVTVAKDGKSFAIKAAGNWIWTYTPTLVQ